jgi:hypothetical protein
MTAFATTPIRRAPGRPRKQALEQRSVQNKQRYTRAELDYIQTMAHQAGLSVSDYIRRAALKIVIKPPRGSVPREAMAELNRIGVNLNQIARALNRGRECPPYIEEAFLKLNATMDKLADHYDP